MKTTYGIAVLEVLNKDITGKNFNLTNVLGLSEEEHELCVQAIAILGDFQVNAQLFLMIVWNYEDFRTLQNQHLTAYVSKDFEALPPRRMDLNLNRCMLNCLSSIRMYLDHVEAYAKEKYGKTSIIANGFLQDCSNAYDSSFSYRFLYKLRNYAQHYGLPLTVMNYNAKLIEANPKKSQRDFVVGIDRDKLLSKKFDGWGTIKQELLRLPAVININPHIDEMVDRLKEIHMNFIANEFISLRESAAYLKSLLEKIPKDYDELYLVAYIPGTDDTIKFNLKPIPLNLVADVFAEKFAALFTDGEESFET